MRLNVNKQSIAIARILLFSIGLILSCNVFAAAGPKATQAALDAAVTNLQEQITKIGSPRFYEIGDRGPAGGIVFFVHTDGQHGLEAARTDQSGGTPWYNGDFTDTEAHGDGVGAGEMNTPLIIANQGSNSNSYAAGICANLVIYNGGVKYGDWYLPSKEELILMYNNLHLEGRGDFSYHFYWSSTELNSDYAWHKTFTLDGDQGQFIKYGNLSVRAIRAF